MNKMGKIKSTYIRFKNLYACRLIHKVLSAFFTVVLIFLLVIGALMFYFNMQAKSYSEKGMTYIPPFGLYTIISGSMQPQINVYDVVVVREVKNLNTLKVGDVITFLSDWKINYGDTITHRIVEVKKNESGEFQFVTKGDFNKVEDGSTVKQNNLIGKVVLRIPQLGRLQFFLATKMGWFIAIFIPALIVIIMDVMKIFKLYIIRKHLGKVATSHEIENKYFENEILEGRELSEADMEKTIIVKVSSNNKAKDIKKKQNSDKLSKITPSPKKKNNNKMTKTIIDIKKNKNLNKKTIEKRTPKKLRTR